MSTTGERRLVAVDWNCRDADGEDYTLRASRKAVRAGHMVNVPVRLRFPDGSERDGNAAMFTAKGIEHLRRTMPVDLRRTGGTA